jgi:serine/threonine-protein kinase
LDKSEPSPHEPDASVLFAAAGLDLKTFKPATPNWTPLAATEFRAAWTGALPGRPETPVRIEAAWWREKPVYFQIVGPWTRPSRMPEVAAASGGGADRYIWIGATLILAGAVLAWRNLRLGRVDRPGAIRLSGFALAVSMASWLLSAHFGSPTGALFLLTTALGEALFVAAQLWLAYMALEPAVRRRWPRILVSWTRVMSGDWKDPVVARDVLVGVIVGLGHDLIFGAEKAVERNLGASPLTSIWLSSLFGLRSTGSGILNHVQNSLVAPLELFLLFFILRLILRKEWLAAIVFVLLFSLGRGLPTDHPAALVPAYIMVYGLVVAMLLRFGLLSVVVALFVTDMMLAFVFTSNFSAWYGTASFTATLLIAALAIVAFRNALGGQKVLGRFLDE